MGSLRERLRTAVVTRDTDWLVVSMTVETAAMRVCSSVTGLSAACTQPTNILRAATPATPMAPLMAAPSQLKAVPVRLAPASLCRNARRRSLSSPTRR